MDKVTKSLLIKLYFVGFGLAFLNFAYQDHLQSTWLWSSFVLALLFSPFSFLLTILVYGVFQNPANFLIEKYKFLKKAYKHLKNQVK
jgi:hypothetical protein